MYVCVFVCFLSSLFVCLFLFFFSLLSATVIHAFLCLEGCGVFVCKCVCVCVWILVYICVCVFVYLCVLACVWVREVPVCVCVCVCDSGSECLYTFGTQNISAFFMNECVNICKRVRCFRLDEFV